MDYVTLSRTGDYTFEELETILYILDRVKAGKNDQDEQILVDAIFGGNVTPQNADLCIQEIERVYRAKRGY